MLSTALRSGKDVSPIVAEIKGSLFTFVYCGMLSTDERKNDGLPGEGSWSPFTIKGKANES